MESVEVKREFKRLNEKLTTLLTRNEQPKATLVKMGIVRELTGLDKEGLRRARNNNLLKQVKTPKGIFYELETINPIILKHQLKVLRQHDVTNPLSRLKQLDMFKDDE